MVRGKLATAAIFPTVKLRRSMALLLMGGLFIDANLSAISQPEVLLRVELLFSKPEISVGVVRDSFESFPARVGGFEFFFEFFEASCRGGDFRSVLFVELGLCHFF